MKMSDRKRIERIISTGKMLMEYVESECITEELIHTNVKVQWTVTTPLYNIGEHTYHISKELQAAYPQIPWRQVAGLRHRLVHDYEDTDWSIISRTVFKALPAFIEQLDGLLSEIPSD